PRRTGATLELAPPGEPRAGRADIARRRARLAGAASLDRDRRPLALVSTAGAPGGAHARADTAGLAALSDTADRRARRDRDARSGSHGEHRWQARDRRSRRAELRRDAHTYRRSDARTAPSCEAQGEYDRPRRKGGGGDRRRGPRAGRATDGGSAGRSSPCRGSGGRAPGRATALLRLSRGTRPGRMGAVRATGGALMSDWAKRQRSSYRSGAPTR